MIPSSGYPPWPPDHPRTLPRTGTPTPPRGARSSRGFDQAGCPTKPLVSYQINRQLSGWNLPPLVIRAVGAHRGIRAERVIPLLCPCARALGKAVLLRSLSEWFGELRPPTRDGGDGALRRRSIKLLYAGWLPHSVFRLGAGPV